MGTSTCHFISSYSIPFHLTALLPLSIPQSPHTDLVNSNLTTTANHSHSLLLCLLPLTKKTAPCKQNYLQEAMPTSSTNQPMAEQAGQQATGIKGAHSDQRDSFIWKGVTDNTHQERTHQDRRYHARLPGHVAS